MTQKKQTRRSSIGIMLVVGWLALPVMTAAASEPDTGWRLRFYAASIDFDNSDAAAWQSHRSSYDVDFGFGLGVNAEYRFSRRLGVDVGILGGAAVDVAWNTVEVGQWVWAAHDTLTFTPMTAGLDIHLTPDKNVDLYFCPMLAWIHYGGLVVYSGSGWTETTIDFDQDLAVGAALGLGVPFGEREQWSFIANLTYLESALESDGWVGGRIAGDYDATMFGLGFGYRFRGPHRDS